MSSLANSIANGDMDELVCNINTALKQVSDDLRPPDRNDTLITATKDQISDKCSSSPEHVFCCLKHINVRNAPGTAELGPL